MTVPDAFQIAELMRALRETTDALEASLGRSDGDGKIRADVKIRDNRWLLEGLIPRDLKGELERAVADMNSWRECRECKKAAIGYCSRHEKAQQRLILVEELLKP